MNILINCSNLKIGGGLQVANSFLNQIREIREHDFIIVLSKHLAEELKKEKFSSNFFFYHYSIKPHPIKAILGNDKYLSKIIQDHSVDVVFSPFGPTYWKPKVKHIVGFAKAQYIYLDSPFFNTLSLKQKVVLNLKRRLHLFDFRNHNDILITENPDVSLKLSKLLKDKKRIETVTNYFNQIYDLPEEWNENIVLDNPKSFQILTISANYPHKNLQIIPSVVKILLNEFPDFNFQFITTVNNKVFAEIKDKAIKERIITLGKVDISQCPNLYKQSSAVFLPSLVETFSATYAEAMRMEKPILTSNLDFARGLCASSAIYFDPLDPEDIAQKIFFLANNKVKQEELIENGKNQLNKFDNYTVRAKKYLDLITE